MKTYKAEVVLSMTIRAASDGEAGGIAYAVKKAVIETARMNPRAVTAVTKFVSPTSELPSDVPPGPEKPAPEVEPPTNPDTGSESGDLGDSTTSEGAGNPAETPAPTGTTPSVTE